MKLFMTDIQEISEKEMVKVAGAAIGLSPEVGNWPAEITNEVYNQLPYLSGKEVNVVLNQVDQNNKSGIGVIEVSSTKDKVMNIPVVIDQGNLYPLDIISINGKMMPATEKSANEYFFEPSLFEGLIKRQKGGQNAQMTDNIFPMNLASNAIGRNPMGKVASINNIGELSSVGNTSIDINKFISNLTPNQTEAFSSFINSINNFSFTKEASIEEEQADACVIYKDGEEVKSISLSKDPFKFISYKGDKLTKIASEVPEEGLFMGTGKGVYEPKDYVSKTGKLLVPTYGEGYAFTEVVGLDGRRVPYQLFIGKDFYSMQEKVAGEVILDQVYANDEIKGKGVFYYDDRGTQKCTIPVTVKGKSGGAYSVETDTGRLFKVAITKSIKQPTLGKDRKTYMLPNTCKFAQINGNMHESLAPTGKELSEVNKVNMQLDNTGFTLSGNPLGNVELSNLPEKVASVVLLGLGAIPEQIKEYMELAEAGNRVTFYTTERFNKEIIPDNSYIKKLASLTKVGNDDITSTAYALATASGDLEEYFTKLGADNDIRTETVDSLLSLNFVNEDNINNFVEALPQFEQTASTLASFMLATRLGLTSLPEKNIRSAIKNLLQVIRSLRILKEGATSPVPQNN
jgi:hypothetical protein